MFHYILELYVLTVLDLFSLYEYYIGRENQDGRIG